MTAMAVLDWAVFGGLASVAVAIFYKAFWRTPAKHRLGGKADWNEVDDGDAEELGIRNEIEVPASVGIERD